MQFQRALITGASSGIGEALCRLLTDQGIDIIAAGRSWERLQAIQLECASKVRVDLFVGDLSNKADRLRLVDLIHDQKPDLIINNAGFGLYGDALTYETEKQLDILEVNGAAVLELTLEGARTLISHQMKGTILNVSSAAAFQVYPGFAVYAACKAFINHFSEALDYEVSPLGVRVLAACPGMVDTQFSTRAGKINQQQVESLVMTPLEVAHLIWEQIQHPVPIRIMNWKYRFLTALTKMIPSSMLKKRLQREIASRIEPREFLHGSKTINKRS